MTTLKDVIRYIVTRPVNNTLIASIILALDGNDDVSMLHNTVMLGQHKSAPQVIEKPSHPKRPKATPLDRPRNEKKRKPAPKPKPKDWDAETALANMGRGGGNPGDRKGKSLTRGARAKVIQTLQETTGKIGAQEMAEYLGWTTRKASTVLSGVFKTQHPGLHREPTKVTLNNGKVVPSYVYWLEGAKS